MASRHVSLRMEQASFERLEAQSRRNREPLSSLAKRLIEEGLRMEAHPGIVFRNRPLGMGREAALMKAEAVWLAISAFPEWDNTWDIRSSELVAASALTPYQILTAQQYYAEYPDEIDERIRANSDAADRGYAEWMKRRQPVNAK